MRIRFDPHGQPNIQPAPRCEKHPWRLEPGCIHGSHGCPSAAIRTPGGGSRRFAGATCPSLLENGAFEDPDLDNVNGGSAIIDGWNTITAWGSDGTSVNSGIQPEGPSAAGTPEGSQVAFLSSNDPSVYQTSDHTIRAGDEFAVQFAGASYSSSATLEASIYYFDGATRTVMETITLTQSDAMDPLSRTAWNIYSLSADVDDFPAAIGGQVGVEFNSQNGLPALDGVVLCCRR